MKEIRINKITTGYQITIPAHYRKQNHLKVGDYITFTQEGDRLIVKPAIRNEKTNAAKIFNDLFKKEIKSAEFDGLSEEEIMDIVIEEIKAYRKSKKLPKAASRTATTKAINLKNHNNVKKKQNNH